MENERARAAPDLPDNISLNREELRKVLDEATDKESAIKLLLERFGNEQ